MLIQCIGFVAVLQWKKMILIIWIYSTRWALFWQDRYCYYMIAAFI